MKKLVTIMGVALIVWLVFSWFDVIADNTHEGAEHNPYNAFVLLNNERG